MNFQMENFSHKISPLQDGKTSLPDLRSRSFYLAQSFLSIFKFSGLSQVELNVHATDSQLTSSESKFQSEPIKLEIFKQ